MDSGDDRYSTRSVGRDWTLMPGPGSALIDRLTDEERTAVIVTLKEKLKGDPRAPHLARGAGEARCIGRKGGATFAQIVPPEIRAHAGHTTAPLS